MTKPAAEKMRARFCWKNIKWKVYNILKNEQQAIRGRAGTRKKNRFRIKSYAPKFIYIWYIL